MGFYYENEEKGMDKMARKTKYEIRTLKTETDDVNQYNALLRYAFQVTEQELAETGWRDDEIKQSKFPVLDRADVLGCFDGKTLISQFAVYPLKMNIYDTVFQIGFVTSVCTYPEYSGHGIMKKLMVKSLTNMRNKASRLHCCIRIPFRCITSLAGKLYPIKFLIRSRTARYRRKRPHRAMCAAWTGKMRIL